jgi:type II pantothenate kinase
MKVLGVDFGASSTDAVIVEDDKMMKKISAGDPFNFANEVDEIVVTGGKSRYQKFDFPVTRVDEIKAIAHGGASLSGFDECLVVSIGTGTAMVSYRNGTYRHVSGTGVGGGTLEGLSRLFGIDLPEIETLALGGKPLDTTVGEVVGGDIGIVPKDATASNFAMARRGARKGDIALSLLYLLAEVIGVLASVTAQKENLENVVFIGRPPKNGVVAKRLEKTLQIYGFKATIPENCEYAVAYGAVKAKP